MYSIEIQNLTKIYSPGNPRKEVKALNNFSIKIPQGSIFGLLGPNGAGKTTLVKVLLGITHPTEGNIKLLNSERFDYVIKSRIGYLPENHKFPAYLSGEEVMKFYGRLSGVDSSVLDKKSDELLELMNLSKWKKAKVRTYSKGMMQRLGLAQALINNPDLIFLDEPTDGVDPIGRKEIRDLLIGLKEKDKTIFINSHLLSEVELVSDRAGILNKGNLIKDCTIKELTTNTEEYIVNVDKEIENVLPVELIEKFNVRKISDGSYSAKVIETQNINELVDAIRNHEVTLKEISLKKKSLEDVFINLIREAEKGEKK
jgi:ABC-2 type transport system ATP-binding protein